jgi:energy-coupling factor transporter transmembrane protein EcfT
VTYMIARKDEPRLPALHQLSPRTVAGIFLLLVVGYCVLLRTYHLDLGPLGTPSNYRIWGSLHFGAGVVVWPLAALLLILRWFGPARRLAWRWSDFLVFILGVGALVFFVSGISYWVQETRLPLAPLISSALWELSFHAPRVLAGLAAGVIVYRLFLRHSHPGGRSAGERDR